MKDEERQDKPYLNRQASGPEAEAPEEARPTWYGRAADGPYRSGGMTPELAARIERAAAARPQTRRRALAAAGAAAALLLVAAAAQLAGGGDGGPGPAARVAPGGGSAAAVSAAPAASPGPAASAAVPGETGAPQATEPAAASSAPSFSPASPAASSSPAPSPPAAEFKLPSGTYSIEVPDEQLKYAVDAAESPEGIVWFPLPKLLGRGTLDEHAATPYKLYLSPKKEGVLSAEATDARLICTLPMTVYLEQARADADMRLNSLFNVGPYVLMSTSAHLPGAAQPSEEKLWLLDLKNVGTTGEAEAKEIVSFHSVGGYQFEMGIDNEQAALFYIYSTPDGNGGYERKARIYHPDSETEETPVSYERREDGSLTYTGADGTHTLKLIWD
ncbi:hypothetical protein [Paenibacillus glufosinatiresistens]|uniref:hypothetical protein n=1 Tax=Paenibacillus glufosinatiresistens TaxID=3070657 RepID=UPI00286D9FF1|nr:hypothetical protein [Paenibacillus sp. YX.27]